jgi:uncharacterized protein YyaL (SSP411 family)
MTAVDLALDWLAYSDVRQADGDPMAQGGVNQGYNWRQRSYPFIYSEITGYAVSTYVNAYRWTGDASYITLASQSANFLLGVQATAEEEAIHGAIPHSLSPLSLELRHRYYSFDAAMCLQGMLHLDTIKPAPELREAARAIGDWLLERMQRNNGAFLSMYDAETDEWQHIGESFYDDGGCLHAKHAIGLLKLGQVTGDDHYTVAAKRVCDWVLALQDDDGAFRATERLGHVVSHPHCYATEGLLFAHHVLGTERYLEAARRAGEWLLRVQNRDGSINIAYKRRWCCMGRRITEKFFPHRVTDATAQAIRTWLILYYLDGEHRFLDACHRAEGFLYRMQCTSSSDRNAVGGFYFWPPTVCGRRHPMMFAWCTMFAINALYALEHVNRGEGYRRMMAELF